MSPVQSPIPNLPRKILGDSACERQTCLAAQNAYLLYGDQPEDGNGLYDLVCRQDTDGVIMKPKESPYASNRWLKIRIPLWGFLFRTIFLFLIPLRNMAGTTRLELATSAVTGQRSNQLNYVPLPGLLLGGQCRTRTCDLLLVRQAL
jgi:hypothetical protein